MIAEIHTQQCWGLAEFTFMGIKLIIYMGHLINNEYSVKGHTSNQLYIETLTTMCKGMPISASSHENVHTITRNSNGIDIKCNGVDSNGMNTFCVFHVNNTFISSDTYLWKIEPLAC